LDLINYRGDLISVAISGSQPLIERPNIGSDMSVVFKDIEELWIPTKRWHSTSDLESIRPRILALIELTSRLANLYRTSHDALIEVTGNMMTFTQLCCAIEHHLLSINLLPTAAGINSLDPLIFINEAARNSALLCSAYLFKNMNLDSTLFKKLQFGLRRSITSLDALRATTIEKASEILLLWAICVGVTTTCDPEWYATHLYRCILNLEIQSLDELRMYLGEYVWEGKMCIENFIISRQFIK
jgi:hypothetical protein